MSNRSQNDPPSRRSAYDTFSNDEPIAKGVAAVWKWMRESGEGDPTAIRRIKSDDPEDIFRAPVAAHVVREGSADWVDRAWAASVAEPTYTHEGEMQVAGDDFAGLHLPDGIIVEPYSDHTLSVSFWPREQVEALRKEQQHLISAGRSALTAPSPWRSFGYRDVDEDD